MKRLILGWLFAIISVSFAFANCPAGTYFTTNETNCIFVSPTNPLPITGTLTATTSEKSTAAAPSYVEGTTNPLSGDLSGNLRTILGGAVPAGTNIIGNVRIDQTTPGTTNGIVATQGTSPWVNNITQFGGSNVVTGTGASGSGIPRVTVSNDTLIGLNASQNGIGNVGGKTVTVCVTPTVTATNAYGTNFVVGGLLTFANLFTSTGSGILQSVTVNLKKVETSGFTFTPFISNPTNTTWTDAQVAAINAADVFAVRAPLALTASSVLGTHTNASAYGLGLAMAPGSTTGYGVLTSNAALTNQFAATSDVQVCATVLQDL